MNYGQCDQQRAVAKNTDKNRWPLCESWVNQPVRSVASGFCLPRN